MEAERVAVLMSVHRSVPAAYLEEAIESILSQSHPSIDLWLACDGPQNEAVGRLIAGLPPQRCYVVRLEKNQGLAVALNSLIDAVIATGRYELVARMDADDVSVQHRIAKQIAFLREHGDVGIVGSWCTEVDSAGRELAVKRLPTEHAEMLAFMSSRNPLVHGSVLARLSVFDGGVRYDPSHRKNQDYDLWSRLAHRGVRLANLPEPLLRFRVDEGFYVRRGGWAMAWLEGRMRYAHLRRFRQRTPRNLARLVGIFALRLSPVWLKRIAYRALR